MLLGVQEGQRLDFKVQIARKAMVFLVISRCQRTSTLSDKIKWLRFAGGGSKVKLVGFGEDSFEFAKICSKHYR